MHVEFALWYEFDNIFSHGVNINPFQNLIGKLVAKKSFQNISALKNTKVVNALVFKHLT
jgi:hypothetical protein